MHTAPGGAGSPLAEVRARRPASADSFSQALTHTPLLPVDKADGIDTKFSFITSSSKSSIGYSFRCSEGTQGERAERDRLDEQAARAPQRTADVLVLLLEELATETLGSSSVILTCIEPNRTTSHRQVFSSRNKDKQYWIDRLEST